MSWCRLWEEMPNDPKWRTISRKSGQSIGNVIAVFIHMMSIASQSDERGSINSFVDEDVASSLDMEAEDVAAIREAMQGRVLDGSTISGWERRQPKREDGSSERAKRWRETKKAEANATERNRTQPNAKKRPESESESDPDSETFQVKVTESSSVRGGVGEIQKTTDDGQDFFELTPGRLRMALDRGFTDEAWLRAETEKFIDRNQGQSIKDPDRAWLAWLEAGRRMGIAIRDKPFVGRKPDSSGYVSRGAVL